MLVSDLPPLFIRVFAFAFGALWGSFFNVAIYRWPRDMSVVTPPSHCPHCQTPVPPWRNVPILGWILLRGRAGCCGHPLSPRYLLVEIIAGAIGLALAERHMVQASASTSLADAGLVTLLFFAFAGGLIVATFVDLEWMEIPDEVSIGGTALGLATVTFRQPGGPDVVDVAVGAGGAFLLVQLLPVWAWERLTGRRGMGEGDSKLLMFVGAFLGWQGALFALVGGAFHGLVVVIVMRLLGRRLGASSADDEASEGEAGEELPGDDTWVPPAPFVLRDGTTVEVKARASELEVRDTRSRLVWAYAVDDEARDLMRRALPFGPFIALAALEFLFFGETIATRYLDLVDWLAAP